ncbi:MAG: hypothetical protein D3922_10995, partial [Candidatus Electrothrix sp. AR1]|nr:hypothetical protein [Candidatus Electrothrix sp. AR1]
PDSDTVLFPPCPRAVSGKAGTDQVLLLDQGKAVTLEHHEHLLLHNDFYQAMAEKQQGRDR